MFFLFVCRWIFYFFLGLSVSIIIWFGLFMKSISSLVNEGLRKIESTTVQKNQVDRKSIKPWLNRPFLLWQIFFFHMDNYVRSPSFFVRMINTSRFTQKITRIVQWNCDGSCFAFIRGIITEEDRYSGVRMYVPCASKWEFEYYVSLYMLLEHGNGSYVEANAFR